MLKLMKAECVMYLGELKQYWVNYVFYNISLLIMFMACSILLAPLSL